MSPNNPIFKRWDRRLQNWALWRVGRSGTASSACDGEHGEGAPRPPPPLVGEALDTNDLVIQLTIERYKAVTAMYVWTGTIEERADRLDIKPKALDERVDAAMFDLDAMAMARRSTKIRTPTCETRVI